MENVKWKTDKEYNTSKIGEIMELVAQIKAFNDNIEEEVIIEVNELQLDVFAVYVPFKLYLKKMYLVELNLFMDEIRLEKSLNPMKSMDKCGQGFEYRINGYLNENGVLDAGIQFKDDIFEEFSYLYGSYISVYVDRIDVDFLKELD